MGGGSSYVPPPPDPYVTAQAQTDANRQATKDSYKYASIDTFAPWGNTTYTRDAEGMPIAQTTSLGPQEQKFYSTSQDVANTLADKARTLSSRIPTDALSFSGLPNTISGLNYGSLFGISAPTLDSEYSLSGLPGITGADDFSSDRDKITDTLYRRQKSLLDPDFKDQERNLIQNLADRGIVEGSDQYNREIESFRRGKGETLSRLADSAVLAGGNEQSRLFGLNSTARQQLLGERSDLANFRNNADQQLFAMEQSLRNQGLNEQQVNAQLASFARQQGISERLTERSQPFNEASALFQGSPALQMPQAPGLPQFGVNPTNIAGLIQNQYQGQVNQAQAKQAAKANTTTQGASAGAAIAGAAIIAL